MGASIGLAGVNQIFTSAAISLQCAATNHKPQRTGSGQMASSDLRVGEDLRTCLIKGAKVREREATRSWVITSAVWKLGSEQGNATVCL